MINIDGGDLVATARRAAGREWTVGPEGPAEVATNPELAELVQLGYVVLHFTPAYKRADDYWTLTDAGRQWLAGQAPGSSRSQSKGSTNMSDIKVTADHVKALLAADYPAVLVKGEFIFRESPSIMAESTATEHAREHGIQVLLTRAEVYETWGDRISDAEAEQYAAEITEQVNERL